MTWALVVAGTAAAFAATTTMVSARNSKVMSDYNAQEQERAAQQERVDASRAEEQQRAEARRIIGSQAAAQAESGVQLNGSAADLFRQSLFNAEMDAQTVRYGGERASASRLASAAGERLGGRIAKTNGMLSASAQLANGMAAGYGARQNILASQKGKP